MPLGRDSQLEHKLHDLFSTHRNPTHGGLDLNNFDNVIGGLGLADSEHQASIRKWKNYYQSLNKSSLSHDELRAILGWNWAHVPRQVVAQAAPVYVQQAAPVYQPIAQAAPVYVQPVAQAAPVYVQQAAPVYQPVVRAPEMIYQKQVIDIEVIGPPPHVDAWLLTPSQGSASFGNHFASFHVIMKEIEQIELDQESKIRGTLQGFNFGTFSPKLDLLHRLVDYCKVLRAELNACANHDYSITQQYNQLIVYVQQYRDWVLVLERRENYYNQMKQFEGQLSQLTIQFDSLTVQYQNALITISDLRAAVAILEEKVRMIKFFQKIIIIQAFENMQHKSDISGYTTDLQGLHAHYHGIFDQIQQSAGQRGGWAGSARSIVTGLREACTLIVENGLMANQRSSLSGQSFLDKPQARALASVILELDHDAHVINHDHVQSYISSNTFENEWLKHTSGSGQLAGRQNIMAFFNHVIDHRHQMTVGGFVAAAPQFVEVVPQQQQIIYAQPPQIIRNY